MGARVDFPARVRVSVDRRLPVGVEMNEPRIEALIVGVLFLLAGFGGVIVLVMG